MVLFHYPVKGRYIRQILILETQIMPWMRDMYTDLPKYYYTASAVRVRYVHLDKKIIAARLIIGEI